MFTRLILSAEMVFYSQNMKFLHCSQKGLKLKLVAGHSHYIVPSVRKRRTTTQPPHTYLRAAEFKKKQVCTNTNKR
jgi:hypothetical protein